MLKFKSCLLAVAASSFVAACGGGGFSDPTNSSFATPDSSGNLARASGSGLREGSVFSSVTTNGYAYEVGSVSNEGLQGFAGVIPGASVSPLPTTGSATMTGSFELGWINSITSSGGSVSGATQVDRGNMTVAVDFGAGTFVGSGTGVDAGAINTSLSNNPFVVNGTFGANRVLTGTASYEGVSGPMRGTIGADEAIGAFHAHTDTHVHAGGFIVN